MTLQECIGRGASSLVYGGLVDGTDVRLAVKITILSSEQDDGASKRSGVLQEATLYGSNLHVLQGNVIPYFAGLYRYAQPKDTSESNDLQNKEVLITLLEDVGDPVGDEEFDAWRSLGPEDR